jgi:hypothetical protein
MSNKHLYAIAQIFVLLAKNFGRKGTQRTQRKNSEFFVLFAFSAVKIPFFPLPPPP